MRISAFCVCFLALCRITSAQDIQVLTNQIGYEQNAPKLAIIRAHAGDNLGAFTVIDQQTSKPVFSSSLIKSGAVDQWKDWIFWTADLSPLHAVGSYILQCPTGNGTIHSFPFVVQTDLLERNTLSNVIYYFKSQRCSGQNDKADANLPFDDLPKTADVHGGWYDATGDYGKHISHISASTYFNPQQIPLTAWVLFKSAALLNQRHSKNFNQYIPRLLDEALYGADYLVRVKTTQGSFLRSVDAPDEDKAAADRRISKELKSYITPTTQLANSRDLGDATQISPTFQYECGYRCGAGLSIAALAVASTSKVSGDFTAAQYLQTARDAFVFLQSHNLQYTNDGVENIVDDYCILMAATELFKATHASEYKVEADHRAASLMSRLISADGHANYWRADEKTRPFFHAADAGLPVVSLLSYMDIADAPTKARVLAVVKKSMECELTTTNEVVNPFGYARQFVQSIDGSRKTTFFFPHDTETAPWWQGENARLASLVAAARMTAGFFPEDSAFQDKLRIYAWNQLNWILGLNPYDVCMLQGSGHRNPDYLFSDSYQYTNAPGGICNGITSGAGNSHDIEFNLSADDSWRWGEQWLPHSTWYLLAISLNH